MSSYTITIAPNDNSGNTTTLLVDASGDEVRITDVHLHAGDGLSAGRLPVVDFGLLLQAIRPTAAAPAQIAATPTPIVDTEPRQRRGGRAATPRTAVKPARAARSSKTARAATGTQEATRTVKQTPRRTPKTAEATAPAGGRAYRRMPEDIRAVLAQAATATAVADHYGVPRHTATGWVRRVRREDATS